MPEPTTPRLHIMPRGLGPSQSPKGLTAREMSCVSLAHLPNKQIAWMMGISVATVKIHFRQAFIKLDCSNRTTAALVFRGIRQGDLQRAA